MNAALLLAALRARSRLFLIILASTVAAALLVSLVMPKTYIARVSLLLDGRDDQSMRSSNGPPERERAGYLQTQVDIVTSPKVARRVAADLHLAEDPARRAKFESLDTGGDILDWLGDNLLRQVKVDTSQSSILQLTYASSDAQFAAKVANGFAQAYVDTVLELRVAPTRQTSAWFNEQLKTLRDNMEEAERRLAHFKRENGIVATDERYDVEMLQLSELAGRVVRDSDGLNERRSYGEGFGDSGAGLQNLKSNLMRAEARLQELSSELGPKHPQYLRQAAEVSSLRSRIDAESRLAVNQAAQAAERSKQRKERLMDELQAQRERVLRQTEARNQMAVLSRDAAIAQNVYDTAMQRFMASSIESRAMQTNVSVLNPAVPPSQPAKPKMLLNMALSVVIGTLLGLAAVYLQEMFDQRVRMQDDLAWDPNLPVLAVINPWNPAADRLPALPGPRQALPGPG